MPAVDLRYARALSAVLSDHSSDTAAIQNQLRDFLDVLESSPELREVLEDPSIPEAQKLNVLGKIQGALGLSDVAKNFIAVVVHNHRLDELSAMISDFANLQDEQSSSTEATIVSARSIGQDDRALLEQKICSITGSKRLQVVYSEDPSLIGGVIVTVGSTVYDGSIRTQLHELKTRLVEAGS
jgi:F-type H+-transporting ATPase subunit delta